MIRLLLDIFAQRQRQQIAFVSATPEKAKVKTQGPAVYVIDPTTATFGFRDSKAKERPDGAVSMLTEYDQAQVDKVGLGTNQKLLDLKRLWFQEVTAKEAAQLLGLSVSTTGKIWAAFSKALQNACNEKLQIENQ